MKKKIKLFSLAIAAALVIGAAVLPAAASEKKYSSMLVLGDSISTGYGLENYTPGGSPYECRSYCNILAESLGLKGRDTYINRAVNGDGDVDFDDKTVVRRSACAVAFRQGTGGKERSYCGVDRRQRPVAHSAQICGKPYR